MNAYRLKPLNFPWPPVLYGAAVLAALLLDHFVGILPSLSVGPVFWIAGGLLITAALAIDVWALHSLWASHTTAMPHRCATRLVTDGPFRYTRNPIYLCYTLLTVALGLITGNAWFFIAAIVAAGGITLLAIRCEEMHLLARFGIDFERYCKRTRRWI